MSDSMVNFKIDDRTYIEYKKLLIDRKETISDNLRNHILKVVADSKKPTVY